MLLAQLSDIHAAPDNNNLSRLASALTWLDTLKPDVIVITDDLVDDSWLAGYQAIAHLFYRAMLIAMRRSTVQPLAARITLPTVLFLHHHISLTVPIEKINKKPLKKLSNHY